MVTGVTNLDGTTAYEYGADGLRSSKTTNGVKTEYVWDGSTLAGEIYGETAAQKFTVTGSTEGIGIALRSTGDTAGVTVGVYPWLGSYGTSIAGTAVASEEIEIYADESDGVITLNNLPAGDYVLYVHSGYGGAGLELNKEGEGAYRDGAAIDGEYVYWLYDEYDSTAYAEKQAARGTGSSDAETNTTYVPITGGASAGVDKKYINGLSLELAVNDVADTQTYIKNHRGDVTALLNGQNLPIANYTYNAYGTERTEAFTYSGYFAKWGSDLNNLRYAGQYLDNETGNYYLRARYYDPATLRFLSEDTYWNTHNMIYGDNPDNDNPVPDITAIMQSSNLYVYGMNNPIKWIDPSGMVAGEKFSSPDEAAKDWAWNYYGASDYVGFECASLIYMDWDEDGKIFYSYTYGVWGEAHGVNPHDADSFVPEGAVVTGMIHSHPNSPDFSSSDKRLAKDVDHWTTYVVVKNSSGGVDVKKWGDTRKGYKESTIVTNMSVASLSNERKKDLENKFRAKWEAHVKNGCPNGFGCEHKTWPRT